MDILSLFYFYIVLYLSKVSELYEVFRASISHRRSLEKLLLINHWLPVNWWIDVFIFRIYGVEHNICANKKNQGWFKRFIFARIITCCYQHLSKSCWSVQWQGRFIFLSFLRRDVMTYAQQYIVEYNTQRVNAVTYNNWFDDCANWKLILFNEKKTHQVATLGTLSFPSISRETNIWTK